MRSPQEDFQVLEYFKSGLLSQEMASDTTVSYLQHHIGYCFKEPNLLQQALTAAAVDETNYDGNRRLAQLGEAMIVATLQNAAFFKGISRSKYTFGLMYSEF